MTYEQKQIVEAIRAFERGEIVVVMDDDGRENEGDLIVAAVHCSPEKMAFIVRHTSGIVCAPMVREDARRLNLAPMVAENDAPHATAFTVSVDYKHGTTTGISADDRTLTVRNLGPSVATSTRVTDTLPVSVTFSSATTGCTHASGVVGCDRCRLSPLGVLEPDEARVEPDELHGALAQDLEEAFDETGVDAAFDLREGRTVSGEMSWAERAAAGSIKGREKGIQLRGTYTLNWRKYSQISGKYGDFRFLYIPVLAG